MGFDGFVVGDWNAHGQVPGCTNTCCAAAINAGVDMFMAPDSWRGLYDNTLAQVQSGEIPMARLDDAVRRILRVKLRAHCSTKGAPSTRPFGGHYELLGSPEHRAVARQAVRESLVLLKNARPAAAAVARARTCSSPATAPTISRKQSGGWTITWQGTGLTNADFPARPVDLRRNQCGGERRRRHRDAQRRRQLCAPAPTSPSSCSARSPYAEFVGDRPHASNSAPPTRSDLELLRRLQRRPGFRWSRSSSRAVRCG